MQTFFNSEQLKFCSCLIIDMSVLSNHYNNVEENFINQKSLAFLTDIYAGKCINKIKKFNRDNKILKQ